MRLLAALTAAVWFATGFSAIAQLSTEEARSMGLEVAWQSHVQLPPSKGIASAHLWAETTAAHQFAIVELNGRTVRVSAEKLDRNGKPIGPEAAKLQAQQEAQFFSFDANSDGELLPAEVSVITKKAFAAIDRDQDGKISYAEHARFIDFNTLVSATLGKNDATKMLRAKGLEEAAQLMINPSGFEVKEVSIPRIKLVLISQNGSVETLDAENGKTLWTNTCGETNAPAFPGAISKAGVVVLQGDHLYVLDSETGKLVLTKPLKYSSSNAVAVTDTMAFVSDFSGRVETYVIGASEYKQRWGYVIRGRATGKTVKMQDRDLCGIASADGFFYVFSASNSPDVWMRYKSATPITKCIGTGNNAFYVGNQGGRLSKIVIDERLGKTAWEYVTGQAFSSTPLVVGSKVFACTDAGALICINDDSGSEAWQTSSMALSEPLGVAGNTVFVRSQSNQFVGLDVETGKQVGRTSALNLGDALVNQLTDRVYLVGSQGQLQCLRPIGGEVPKLVTNVVLEKKSTKENAPATPAENTNPMNEGNPFGGESPADPFATPAQDPFGGAPEPSAEPMSDPFAPGN